MGKGTTDSPPSPGQDATATPAPVETPAAEQSPADASQQPPESAGTPAPSAEKPESAPSLESRLEAIQAELEETKKRAQGIQSKYDREVVPLRQQLTDYQNRLLARETEADQAYWDAKRRSEDPTERDEFLKHLDDLDKEREIKTATEATAKQEAWDNLTSQFVFHPDLGFSDEQRSQAWSDAQAMAQSQGRPFAIHADIIMAAHRIATAQTQEQLAAAQSRVGELEQENAALQAQIGGDNIGTGGPHEAPVGGPGQQLTYEQFVALSSEERAKVPAATKDSILSEEMKRRF